VHEHVVAPFTSRYDLRGQAVQDVSARQFTLELELVLLFGA